MSTQGLYQPGRELIEVGARVARACDSARCSLIEALTRVGRAMNGDRWTGDELNARYWPHSPLSVAERSRVITKAPPPIPTSFSGNYAPRRQEITSDARKALEEGAKRHLTEQQKLWQLNTELVDRLSQSVDWIARQCRDGNIKTFYRFEHGGSLIPMEPGDWNVDNPLETFFSKGGYERWFSSPHPRKYLVYVFLDRVDLDHEITLLPNSSPPVKEADLARLSPYLRFAVKTALKHGWTSAKEAGSRDYRQAEIQEAWSDAFPDLPCTASQVERLAGVTGFPNPEGIRNGMRAAKKRGNGGNPGNG